MTVGEFRASFEASTWGRGRPARPSYTAGGTPAVPGQAIPFLSLFFALLIACAPARAHTPDTSYCTVAIGREEVATTFTYDLATLARMTAVDRDGDGQVTFNELLAAMPDIETFLRRHVFLELNEREAIFGELRIPTWPPDAGDAIAAADFGQRLMSFTFQNSVLHAPDAMEIGRAHV